VLEENCVEFGNCRGGRVKSNAHVIVFVESVVRRDAAFYGWRWGSAIDLFSSNLL
jgi:hypothetical protein